MRNRDLPVIKSLPSYTMYTYIRTRTVQYLYCMYLYTVPYQPSSDLLCTFIYCNKVSTYLQGQEESRIIVLYIFLVRHASFINFLFFFAFCCKGNSKTTYLPTYLTWLFFMDAFYWFYQVLGKVGTVVGSSSLRGRKLAGWLVGWLAGWCTIRGIPFWGVKRGRERERKPLFSY